MPILTQPQPARHPNPTAKAEALAYLVFDRPDLDRAEKFLTEFGLRTVSKGPDRLFLRAADSSPFCYIVQQAGTARFRGMGFRFGSDQALEKLSRLPGASPIEEMNWPGGGRRVRLTDPSGFEVDAVFGQAEADPLCHRGPTLLNAPDRDLRIDLPQRLPHRPPEVIKLGHAVIEVADYQATSAWYSQHFGLIPSDVQVLPDGSPAVTFFRLDLGDRPADHHTLAMAQGFMPAYSHSAFELIDPDAIGMGSRILRESGWRHAWGIGRHILGSQIFDYWQDPWGDKHEHYCDGDLFTADLPMGVHAVSREAMAQWGPVMPRSFTKPKLGLPQLAALLRNLRRSPDLSLRKLATLAKLFG